LAGDGADDYKWLNIGGLRVVAGLAGGGGNRALVINRKSNSLPFLFTSTNDEEWEGKWWTITTDSVL
jgi:hypothetical protein